MQSSAAENNAHVHYKQITQVPLIPGDKSTCSLPSEYQQKTAIWLSDLLTPGKARIEWKMYSWGLAWVAQEGTVR